MLPTRQNSQKSVWLGSSGPGNELKLFYFKRIFVTQVLLFFLSLLLLKTGTTKDRDWNQY